VSGRFLRSLLVLAGAYWVAEWLVTVITAGEAALGIEYSGVGRLGELWIDVCHAAPRALAAAGRDDASLVGSRVRCHSAMDVGLGWLVRRVATSMARSLLPENGSLARRHLATRRALGSTGC
jgi:hypothetical protein